jgi:hypothetical protein
MFLIPPSNKKMFLIPPSNKKMGLKLTNGGGKLLAAHLNGEHLVAEGAFNILAATLKKKIKKAFSQFSSLFHYKQKF